MSYLNDKMGKLKGKLDSTVVSKPKPILYFDKTSGVYKAEEASAE